MRGRFVFVILLAIVGYRFARNSPRFYTIDASVSWRQQRRTGLKPITVTLEKGKETTGTYRLDSPDSNAAITSLYVRKSAFDGETVSKRIILTVAEAEG